jgi:hypothetical protein
VKARPAPQRHSVENRNFTNSPMDREYSSPDLVKSKEAAVKVLPAEYNMCPMEDLVVLVACMLSEIIQVNDRRKSGVHTRFHSRFVLQL